MSAGATKRAPQYIYPNPPTVALNDNLVRDIIYCATNDPSSLRFKFYAREMEYVRLYVPVSPAVREILADAASLERTHGHH